MFHTTIRNTNGDKISCIGRIRNIEDTKIVLDIGNEEINVIPVDISEYDSDYMFIHGIIVDENTVQEEYCYKIPGDFDYENYTRFAETQNLYPSIF